MVSQDKLIKQGIKYTDSLFDEITKRLEQGVKASDTLEAFLDKYHKAFPDKDNPLITLGYDKEMLKIILSETNNHKFSRPAQKELVRVTIENRVGENIVDVGDEIRDSVREIVKDGYNNNLSQDKIAENISSKVSGIKNRRARAIARTEIARAATVSDYIINKERGATHFYVECRNTACPICKKTWHKGWTEENDATYKPRDKSAGGKGWIGNNVYSMSNTGKLPPIHPNCRCVPYFINEDGIEDGMSVVKEQTKPANNESLLEQHPSTKPANNTLLRGEPEVYEDVDNTGKKLKVYKYDNIELAFNENAKITHEDLVNHINSLPKVFEETQAKRIFIHDYQDPNLGGAWNSTTKELHVYESRKSVEGLYQVFNHEFAHSLDMFWINESPKAKYSDPKIYQKIFEADNKLGYSDLGIIQPEVPIKWVTNYAGRSYLKYMKASFEEGKEWAKNKLFTEDFAEASAYYLNPNQHEQFVKDFPNRAKYLESIYGKPDFTNSGIKVMSELSPEQLKLYNNDIDFKSITKRDVREFYEGGFALQRKLLDQQRDELREEIERLTEERRKVRRTRKECETEECYDKITLKVSEMKIQIKRLEKVDDELFTKWSKTFDEMRKMKSIFS
jgi:hypothetical protein